ncbi:MAG: chorismate mutase [Lachnospiraceae bacterium]|nr:chorismate mutase [Lachnospiraceae bacterium]
MKTLDEIRKEIDELDDKFVELFKQRMALSKQVADSKRATSTAVLNSSREQDIIDRLTENEDEINSEYIERLYRHIFELSRDYQKRLLEK